MLMIEFIYLFYVLFGQSATRDFIPMYGAAAGIYDGVKLMRQVESLKEIRLVSLNLDGIACPIVCDLIHHIAIVPRLRMHWPSSGGFHGFSRCHIDISESKPYYRGPPTQYFPPAESAGAQSRCEPAPRQAGPLHSLSLKLAHHLGLVL